MIEEADQHLPHDAASDLTQSVTVALDLGFFQDVVPERGFLIPAHRAKSGLLPGEGSSADMARESLAGGEANGVAALEIARGQAVKRLDLDVAGNHLGQVHDGAAEPAVDLLGALGRRAAREVEESGPVHDPGGRNRSKTHQVGKEGHRWAPGLTR